MYELNQTMPDYQQNFDIEHLILPYRVKKICKENIPPNLSIKNSPNNNIGILKDKTNIMHISSSGNVNSSTKNSHGISDKKWIKLRDANNLKGVYQSFKIQKSSRNINLDAIFKKLNCILIERNNSGNIGKGEISEFKMIFNLFDYVIDKQAHKINTRLLKQMFSLYCEVIKHYRNEEIPHLFPLYLTDRMFQISENIASASRRNNKKNIHIKELSNARRINHTLSKITEIIFYPIDISGEVSDSIRNTLTTLGEPSVISFVSHLNLINTCICLEKLTEISKEINRAKISPRQTRQFYYYKKK